MRQTIKPGQILVLSSHADNKISKRGESAINIAIEIINHNQ